MRPPSVLILVAFALSGCAQGEPDMVRVRAAHEFHCAGPGVTVHEIGAPDEEDTLYEAHACGHVGVYRCTRTMTTTGEPGGEPATQADRPITVCQLDRR
ncbi:MAG TPA: hypothetical protein VIF15_01400 [Polyangiaceae bacterium]